MCWFDSEYQAKAATDSTVATSLNGDAAVPIAQPQPRFKIEGVDIVMSSSEPAEDDVIRAELMTRRSSESASPRKLVCDVNHNVDLPSLAGEISEASLPVTRSITKSPIGVSHQYSCELLEN